MNKNLLQLGSEFDKLDKTDLDAFEVWSVFWLFSAKVDKSNEEYMKLLPNS